MKDKIVLAIDDDDETLALIDFAFDRAGIQVYSSLTGEQGLAYLDTHYADLVLLDIMMPGLSGWEVCAEIRQRSDVPIIFLSALAEDEHIVRGLNDGAVDYITKPFSPKILIARVQKALRYAQSATSTPSQSIYEDERLQIDLDNNFVSVQGQRIKLTGKENQLLAYLVQNKGQVMTFQQILTEIWGWEYQDSTDYVHVHVARLRRKLEEDPKSPVYLQTEHGRGYQFVDGEI